MTAEHFGSGPKKGRGLAHESLDLIDAMRKITRAAQPITGRGVGYKLFAAGLIPSMSKSDMKRVYRLLKEARERAMIPWDWIVDETRELEKTPSWKNPAAYARAVIKSYRRDYWNQQPRRVEVWSEKGTVRGVLQPILDEYAVGFRVMHGFGSATAVHDAAHGAAKALDVFDVLYVGDFDPSGLWMSQHDLPERIRRYGGHFVSLHRIALMPGDLADLSSFPASDKEDDSRYRWFVENYGPRCWELDAMDPNDLRSRVEEEILKRIEPTAWNRCKVVEKAEQESLVSVMKQWGTP